jgi:transposase
VTDWKKQAMEGMVEVFTGKTERHTAENEAQIKELHAKIGQLTVERDFLAKAFGR